MIIFSLLIANSSHIVFFWSFFSIVIILPVHIHGFLWEFLKDDIVIKVKSNLVIQTPESQNKELAVIWSTQKCQDVVLFLNYLYMNFIWGTCICIRVLGR